MKDRIRRVREKSGMTLTKFAESLGLTVSAVSLYESGKRIPSNSVLNSISNKFHISLDWLKTGEGPMEVSKPDNGSLDWLMDTYKSLPDHLKALVDALAEMDPEWWKTLDTALAEIERRKKGGAE